jgi:hypothetical protein
MTEKQTETKTRTPSMKWIKLTEGKEPEFDTPLFLTDGKIFFRGILIKIEQVSGTEKRYSFNVGLDGAGEPLIIDYATHYCVPVSPTN